MAADQGLKIVEEGGIHYLTGELNEYADLSSLLSQPGPLVLNLRGVSRLNSIGIRNLLKFLADWGAKAITYDECPCEFIDQINMIPALLGTKEHATIRSLFVPYECRKCEHEDEVLGALEDFTSGDEGGSTAVRKCPNCGEDMTVLTDSFFVFLSR